MWNGDRSTIGWRRPWGTTYAVNLREIPLGCSEDAWVERMKTKVNLPPMPWYQL